MHVVKTRLVIGMMLMLTYMVPSNVFAQLGNQRNPDYIGGPWIFTAVPCEKLNCDDVQVLNIDSLSRYTDQKVAEINFAKGKSKPEEILFLGGRLTWHTGFLAGRHHIFTDNIGDLVDGVELNPVGYSNAVFYGLIVLNVDRASKPMMHLGYSAYAKVWLNGEVVYESEERMWDEASEMTQRFLVPVKKGKNLLMAKVIEGIGWNLFVNIKTNFKVSYRIRNGIIVLDDILPVEPSTSNVSTRWALLKKGSRF